MLMLVSAGCMSLRVETRRDAGVLDSLNASLGIDSLSERTMSTLRDEGLEAVWQNQPESAVDTLFKTAVETPTADRLFALAEMHHASGLPIGFFCVAHQRHQTDLGQHQDRC